jgi:hypothetical protein
LICLCKAHSRNLLFYYTTNKIMFCQGGSYGT